MIVDIVNPNELNPNELYLLAFRLVRNGDIGAGLYYMEQSGGLWAKIKDNPDLRIRLGLDRDLVITKESGARMSAQNIIEYLRITQCGKDYMKLPREEFEAMMDSSPEIQRAEELRNIYGNYTRELSLEDFE